MVPPKRTDNIQLARNEDRIHNGSRYPKHDFQRNPVPIHLESRKHPKSFPIPSLLNLVPHPQHPQHPQPHPRALSAGASAAVPNAAPASPRARHSPSAAPASGTAPPEVPVGDGILQRSSKMEGFMVIFLGFHGI